MPRRVPFPPPLSFPDPADEDAFLRSYAQRCLLSDAISAATVLALLLALAAAPYRQGFGSLWSFQPHAIAMFNATYSLARLVYLSLTRTASSGKRSTGTQQQPRAGSQASQAAAGPTATHPSHPDPPPEPPPQQLPPPPGPISTKVRAALDTLLGHRSRHNVLLAGVLLQPCLLLGTTLLAKGSITRQVAGATLLLESPTALLLEIPCLSFCVPMPLSLILPACVAKLAALLAVACTSSSGTTPTRPPICARALLRALALMLPPVAISAVLEWRWRRQYMASKADGRASPSHSGSPSGPQSTPAGPPSSILGQAAQPAQAVAVAAGGTGQQGHIRRLLTAVARQNPQAQGLAALSTGPGFCLAPATTSAAAGLSSPGPGTTLYPASAAPRATTSTTTSTTTSITAASSQQAALAAAHGSGRRGGVVVSVKAPTPPGMTFGVAATAMAQHTLQAVEQAASASGLRLLSSTSAAMEGCVHLVLTADVALPGQPGQQDADLTMTAGQIRDLVYQHLSQAGLAPAADADADGADVAAAAQGTGLEVEVTVSDLWGADCDQGQAAVLVRPACLPLDAGPDSPGAGSTRHVVEALLLAGAAEQEAAGLLAAGSRVAVLLDDSSKADGADTACYVYTVQPGSTDEGAACNVVSCKVDVGPQPAVLLLHLLPDSSAAASPADGISPSPLASLPLLVLPAAAAQEVQALYGRAVVEQQAAEAAAREAAAAISSAVGPCSSTGPAAGSGVCPAGPARPAALTAYWQSAVPFARAWVPLLGPAPAPPPPATAGTDQAGSPGEGNTGTLLATGSSVSQLLVFLERQRMLACLDVAMEALELRPELQEAVAACLSAEAGRQGTAPAAGPAGSAGRSRSRGPAAWLGHVTGMAAAAAMVCLPLAHGAGAARNGISRGSATRAAAAVSDTGYRLHKASKLVSAEQVLGAASAAYLAVMVPGILASAGCTHAAGICWLCWASLAAVLVNLSPYLLQRVCPAAWYAQHRQNLMVCCIVAPKAFLAACLAAAAQLAQVSYSCGQTGRVVVPLLGHLLLVPLLQHALLQPSLPLALCQSFTTWLWGWWSGWPAGGCAGLVLAMLAAGVAPAVGVDGRMRRRYGVLLARRAANGRA